MSNVNVNRAIAMALAGNYKIGGDGEMMVQETLWEGNADTEGYEITIDYKKYDLLVIGMCPNSLETKRGTNNILIVSKIDPSIVYIQNCATSNGSVAIRYIFENNKLIVVLVNGNSGLGWPKPSIREVIGIKFTGTKSIDYSTEEQVIGKWIDGKPLYQRVVSFDDKPSVTNWAPLFDDTYYDQLIECKEIIKTGNSSYCYYSDASTEPRYGIIEHKLCYYRTTALSGRKLVIQYTKTTD